MELKWHTFQEQVRDIAVKVYGAICDPVRFSGFDLDGLIELGPDNLIAILCATDIQKSVIDPLVDKAASFRRKMIQSGTYVKAFVVVRGNIGESLIQNAEREGVTLASVSSFGSLLIQYEEYVSARERHPFGSSIDPATGEADRVKYIPVFYRSTSSLRSYTAKDLAAEVASGKKIVLLGEFGSGKSRCISEIFLELAPSWSSTFNFAFAINLRECWGMQSGDELIRRHLSTLNLKQLEASAVKVFRRNAGIYLLDGFDEMGSQAWSSDETKLRVLRAQALSGVRDLIQNTSGGCLIAGREHYFSSHDEMVTALGLQNTGALVVRVHEEFTVEEMEDYFDAADITVALPSWLPRRPLICQTISRLDDDEIGRMFSEERHEAEFWEHFIGVVCKRDARISTAFDEQTIFAVYLELSRLSRVKQMNVGPFNLRDLQRAFESAVGQAPTDDASVMLQRLPSLGRVGPESADRQFVDTYILDGLRGRDVARLPDLSEEERARVLNEEWINPLSVLGQRVLAISIDRRQQSYFSLLNRCVTHANSTLSADLASSFLHCTGDAMDFAGVEITGATFANLNLSLKKVSNLKVRNSIIEELVLPSIAPKRVEIIKCSAGSVAGATTFTGLPGWARLDSVDEFDSVQNVARIRAMGLTHSQEIFIGIVKKTFFQKGAGRKEDSLLRGFGSGSSPKTAEKVLNLLVRWGVLSTFKGNEGTVYVPVRSEAGRMEKIRQELVSSQDPLWNEVSGIR